MLAVGPEVAAALEEGVPVVALESTVISHGLPYPQNLELADRMEALVRQGGAVPATIALADGQVRIGIGESLREELAKASGVAKVSLRDLGLVLAEGRLGATTVATTMWAARAAGIAVFATGGIGGVHPGDGSDVSADLPALATIPVAVVASGAKAILDLPRTREWLETWGVPILGLGTPEFPAFYSRRSGLPVDRQVATPEAAAPLVRAHLALGRGGILVGSPVPAAAEIPADVVATWIAEAIAAAAAQGIRGHALTPFLLAELGRRSEGATTRANLALLAENAVMAARLALALAAAQA
jgi:pseudouridine-5'-phosphate glycosidase